MSDFIVVVVCVASLASGIVLSWLLVNQYYELKMTQAELDFSKKLSASLKKQHELLGGYEELSKEIQRLSTRGNVSTDELNKLHKALRDKMSGN